MQPRTRSRQVAPRHLPLQLAGQRPEPEPGLHPGVVAAYDPLPIHLRAGLDTNAVTSIVMYSVLKPRRYLRSIDFRSVSVVILVFFFFSLIS